MGLQGAQHYEYLKQLPEQKKLLSIQLKLAEHQLTELEDFKQKRDMVRLPGNFVRPPPPPPPALQAAHQAVTRSMARQGLGSPLMPPGEFLAARRMQPLPPRIATLAGFENPAYQRTPPPPIYASPIQAPRIATPLSRQAQAPRNAVALELTPLVRRAQAQIEVHPNVAFRPAIASPPMGSRIPRLQNRLAPPRLMHTPFRRPPPLAAADPITRATFGRLIFKRGCKF